MVKMMKYLTLQRPGVARATGPARARRRGRRFSALLMASVVVVVTGGGLASSACAQTLEVDMGRLLPPGFRVKATVDRRSRRDPRRLL